MFDKIRCLFFKYIGIDKVLGKISQNVDTFILKVSLNIDKIVEKKSYETINNNSSL